MVVPLPDLKAIRAQVNYARLYFPALVRLVAGVVVVVGAKFGLHVPASTAAEAAGLLTVLLLGVHRRVEAVAPARRGFFRQWVGTTRR